MRNHAADCSRDTTTHSSSSKQQLFHFSLQFETDGKDERQNGTENKISIWTYNAKFPNSLGHENLLRLVAGP